MKKVFAILLSAAMATVLLCACGKTDAPSSEPSSASEGVSSAPVIEEVDVLENCSLSDEEKAKILEESKK